MALHKVLPVSELHKIQSLEYANESARTSATGLTADDVGRVAHQTDNDSFWLLIDHSPLTWREIAVAGATADEKVKVSANDTTPGLLGTKLSNGTGINLTELNDGGDETLQISASSSGLDHGTLSGLEDDDHTQYHNDSRADSWLSGTSIDQLNDVDTTTSLPSSGQQLTWNGSAWVPDEAAAPDSDINAKVSSNDSQTGYLNGKLVGSTSITLTEQNDGGDETLKITVAAAGIDHGGLGGLGDDDHGIYHTNSRADTWFAGKSAGGGLNGTYPNPEVSGMDNGHLADDTAHGDLGGGSLHDVATESVNGFMSSTDKTKLDNMSDNGSGDDWCTGLAISEHDPNNQTVDYTSGTYMIDGISKSVSSGGNYDLTNGYGSVNHYTALGNSQRRRVLIYVDNDEVIKSVAGPVSSTGQTELPVIPDDSVPLAYILIRKLGNGDPVDIKDNRIKDLRYSKASVTIDELASCSITDDTSDFLINKLSNNGNVNFTLENAGGAETIKADVKALGITDSHVAAENKDGTAGTASMRTLGTGAQQSCAGNDSRLSDARTPTSHASSHQNGGSDEVATATPGANAIPKADGTGKLADGWIPDAITRDTELSSHTSDTGNPHSTDVGNLGSGTLSELNSAISDATLIDTGDSRLSDDRTASGLRTATTVVAISSATAPSSGQVLTATASNAANWQTPSAGTNYTRDFDADQLLSPNTSDWTVNALAPLVADSNNSALSVRLFDDTTEEGVGFTVDVPSGMTNMKIKIKSRAETAPGGARTVGLKLYNRGIGNNSAVESWSAGNTLNDIDIPTNEYWQYDEQTISLSTLGVTAGEFTQFELTRVNPSAGTELSGDLALLSIGVEFT